MKDWEIAKVNHLYQQVDALQNENRELRQQDHTLEVKIDQLLSDTQHLRDTVTNAMEEIRCTCCEPETTKPAKKASK